MRLRRHLQLGLLFLIFVIGQACLGQQTGTAVCSAFSGDGSLVMGTIHYGVIAKGASFELETKNVPNGSPIQVIRTEIAGARNCSESFSGDGRWVATVVVGDSLTVVIFDRKRGTVYRQFSSEWQTFNGRPAELVPNDKAGRFTGGFLPSGDFALWRYVPHASTMKYHKYEFDVHMQTWDVEGALRSDIDLGPVGPIFNFRGMQPIPSNNFGSFLVPDVCEIACGRYKSVETINGAQVVAKGTFTLPRGMAADVAGLPDGQRILAISGDQSTSQKATIFDWSGRVVSEVSLPFVLNTIWLLMPDWYWVQQPRLSPDGEIAAVGRSLVAWVLVDDDRDWGSEIVILKTHPLTVAATIKTGKGGVSGLSVDHRNGMIRVAGYWGARWHAVQRDEHKSFGKWIDVESSVTETH